MKTFLEAWINPNIKKTAKFGLAGKVISPEKLGKSLKVDDYYSERSTPTVHSTISKIGTLKGLDVYRSDPSVPIHKNNESKNSFILHDPRTNQVHIHVKGDFNDAKGFHVQTLGATNSPVKAQDFYHHLLKKGHVSSLVGTEHSEGGQKVWQRLSKKNNISVHGWDDEDEKPVNVNPRDPDQTHADIKDYSDDVGHMALVASYHSNFKKKVRALKETVENFQEAISLDLGLDTKKSMAPNLGDTTKDVGSKHQLFGATTTTEIGKIKGYNLKRTEHADDFGGKVVHFTLHDPETDQVKMQVIGKHDPVNGSYKIGTIGSEGGMKVKAQDVYHHILKKGHATTLIGTSHSEGGQKIWQNLSKKNNISVHGWDNKENKPVNLDPLDPDQTHTSAYTPPTDPDFGYLRNTDLVASYHSKLKSKQRALNKD